MRLLIIIFFEGGRAVVLSAPPPFRADTPLIVEAIRARDWCIAICLLL